MTKDGEVEGRRVLDDGVNDAWYKSECGQACGFGGEKFKWLVRMVLLHPCSRCSTFPLLLLLLYLYLCFPHTLARSVAVNPESEKLGFGHFLHFRRVYVSLASRYRIDVCARVSFFV